MLESKVHGDSSFVTLTYRPEVLPPGGTLVPKHTQDWLKRLRKAVNNPLRFFLVGEYGDQSQRPHYHVALFGHAGCIYNGDDHSRRTCNCSPCATIRDTWKAGQTDNAYLTLDSAQYIAGYVTKKLTSPSDPRLNGRHPEFARMSNGGGKSGLGGIGAPAVDSICEVLTSTHGCDSIIQTGDVPLALRSGTKNLPLGRYLRRKIREKLGHRETSTPQEMLLRLQFETTQTISDELKIPENKSKSVKKILLDLNKQKVLNLENRIKIYSKKGAL